MSDAVAPGEILTRITAKRQEVTAFLAAAQPKKRRLLNTTIVGGTLAAALTAGPAVGGASFTAWLTQTLGLTSPSWRLLCGAATVSSVLATLATQLLKSNNIEEHVARAQACRAKLEVLETAVALRQMDIAQATSEYLKCVEEASFLGPS
jgi:MFS family permease